jgi:hemerythrin
MNAIETPKLQPLVVQLIVRDHEALREKISRIHSVLADPVPDRTEIDSLLRELLDALQLHFATEEEEEGFFSEITAHSPRLVGTAARLCVEHRHLAKEAEELSRFATAGSPSMPWWRELRTRCHSLSKRLMQHENDEHELLHEAHSADIGVCD